MTPLGIERRAGSVSLSGDLRFDDGAVIWRELSAAAQSTRRGTQLDIELSAALSIDGAVAALLVAIRAKVYQLGGHCAIVGANPQIRRLLEIHHGFDTPRPPPPPLSKVGFVERTGEEVQRLARAGRSFVEFIGELVAATFGALRRPTTGNWRAVFSLAARAGTDGVPIVLLLDFLVGFVMGSESSRQLELYGANVFVADVVGISVTRELGPLVTGIIIIGRSGAAYAAEIGTMKVSSELDALRTMGLSPPRYLVLPRVLALVLVAPALTLLGDVVGVAGGAVVGALTLGVSPAAYLAELREALLVRDVTGGLIKSVAFGLTIGLIACQQGLATRGGATGVGRRTTSTVVTSLFAVVVLDAVFSVVFRVLRQ